MKKKRTIEWKIPRVFNMVSGQYVLLTRQESLIDPFQSMEKIVTLKKAGEKRIVAAGSGSMMSHNVVSVKDYYFHAMRNIVKF